MHWKFCNICSILGAILFVVSFAGATSAVQESAAAAAGIALAVIPYCYARSRSELLAIEAEDRLKNPSTTVKDEDSE